MGREVRKVQADWKHPMRSEGKFIPLDSREYLKSSLEEYEEMVKEEGLEATIADLGNPPDLELYMPNWSEEEMTHFMMYENTSEGTPISPAFETPEELAQWLVDNEASAFAGDTASYEGWLKVCKGAYAVSAVYTNGKMTSGVDSLPDAKR